MEQLIAIVGPTAVGKTKVSIDLAKKLGSEIISGDSMLVYKGLDIGTAKPSVAERQGVKHHLIDILDPKQDFSVVDFQQLAGRHIESLNKRGVLPVIAGGTGLYIKALLEGYMFNSADENTELRDLFENIAEEQGNEYLHDMLSKVDPANAARLHPNDRRRVIRALEVFHLSGSSLEQKRKAVQSKSLVYDAQVIGLTMERQKLYSRINDRVDVMLSQGLIDEVAMLLKCGVPSHAQAMQGIGYKEVVAYLEGKTNFDAMVMQIKQATRRFAKRQLTWYKKMDYIIWFDIDNFPCYDAMLETIYKKVQENFV